MGILNLVVKDPKNASSVKDKTELEQIIRDKIASGAELSKGNVTLTTQADDLRFVEVSLTLLVEHGQSLQDKVQNLSTRLEKGELQDAIAQKLGLLIIQNPKKREKNTFVEVV